MTFLVTGSSGHLGEALVRTLQAQGRKVVAIDIRPGAFTHRVGSTTDRDFVDRCMKGVTAVLHAATLHKPHVATHSRQDFVDVNVTGTLNLLEAAAREKVAAFVYTSTTSVFGDALVPPPGEPAAWITESVVAVPKNIYGVTKAAAEDLCQLFARNHSLAVVVLRTSRFFPEKDDNPAIREAYEDANVKVNEFLYRRVDIEDVVSAHLLAADHARSAGFAKFIISATTPFSRDDVQALRSVAPQVVRRYAPDSEAEYARRGWTMPAGIDRVYANDKARASSAGDPGTIFSPRLPASRRTAISGARLRKRSAARAIMIAHSRTAHIRSNESGPDRN